MKRTSESAATKAKMMTCTSVAGRVLAAHHVDPRPRVRLAGGERRGQIAGQDHADERGVAEAPEAEHVGAHGRVCIVSLYQPRCHAQYACRIFSFSAADCARQPVSAALPHLGLGEDPRPCPETVEAVVVGAVDVRLRRGQDDLDLVVRRDFDDAEVLRHLRDVLRAPAVVSAVVVRAADQEKSCRFENA